MRKKIVALPIEVPNSEFCWKYDGSVGPCEYFDTQGGHPMCYLNMGLMDLKHDHGVLKPEKCLNLTEAKK